MYIRKELGWVIPAIGLTILDGALAISTYTSTKWIIPTIEFFGFWILNSAIVLLILTAIKTLSLLKDGEDHPFQTLKGWINLSFLKSSIAPMLLAGACMTTFLIMKPLLNVYVPFRFDPIIADLDKAIFFGHDPWVFLTWVNFDEMTYVYHPVWFTMITAALLALFSAPASPAKSAMALSYFVLWTVGGPAIHILMPTAGPIFYEPLGYGDRFSGLQLAGRTEEVRNYLWAAYANEETRAAAGISAMPSMHVAMCVWAVQCIAIFSRAWFIPAFAAAAVISALSVALGWHYALDGIVGGLAALFCSGLFHHLFQRRAAQKVPNDV